MLARPLASRGDGAGFMWPVASPVVSDVFGPRPFPAHSTGHDFHRAIDIAADAGDPVYAPMAGAVIRSHWTHLGFDDPSHLDQLVETDAASSAAWAVVGTALRLTASRVGSQTFPTNVAHLRPVNERMAMTGGDWVLEVELSAAPSVVGGVGIAVGNAALSQYLAVEYDGTTVTARGVDSGGALTNNGATSAQANITWLRLEYASGTDTVSWRYSTDGETWGNVATEATHTFTSGAVPLWSPILYWRSGDTHVGTYTIDVERLCWTPPESIDRFGNWITISNGSYKAMLMHLERLVAEHGDFVQAGQLIGYVFGKAGGFDVNSGRVVSPHVHLEIAATGNYNYAQDEQINPLGVGLLPRTNVSNNYSVVRTQENDPDGHASHKLAITGLRADSDFDLNTITIVGNLASRTVNFNTRAGLNPSNDEPYYDGLYLEALAFDEASASYQLNVYGRESVIGPTFVSYAGADTASTSLFAG
jgi:hypothetical protein